MGRPCRRLAVSELLAPEGGWSQYDIHHIIPREYGGTNDFSNLTPVLRSVHQTGFNPWWMGYGG